MVEDGISSSRIRHYLRFWARWWARTSEKWTYDELLKCLMESCYHNNPALEYAAGLCELFIRNDFNDSSNCVKGCQ